MHQSRCISQQRQWCTGKFGTVGTLRSPPSLLSLHSFSFLFPSFPPFPALLSQPSSGGNNFNDFPENQLTIDFAFLCKPAWGNITVSPFPLGLIIIWGNGVPPRSLLTTPLHSVTHCRSMSSVLLSCRSERSQELNFNTVARRDNYTAGLA